VKRRRVRTAVAAGLAVAVAVTVGGFGGVSPAPAGAQEIRLEAAKRAATGAITRRMLAVRERITAAKSIVRLGADDRTELVNQLQGQVDGLTTLSSKIQGDGDEATLRADAQRIVTDYRVYLLTIPKARGIVIADIELAAADRLTRLADRLATAIDQAKGDTSKANADLAALRAKVAAVTSAVAPLPAQLLALQPSGYPANHTVLEQVRQALRANRAALTDAATLARQVLTDLK
jgi:hypothetical protein